MNKDNEQNCQYFNKINMNFPFCIVHLIVYSTYFLYFEFSFVLLFLLIIYNFQNFKNHIFRFSHFKIYVHTSKVDKNSRKNNAIPISPSTFLFQVIFFVFSIIMSNGKKGRRYRPCTPAI